MSIPRTDWPRLLTLVEQALDLPANERDAWLQTLDLPAPIQAALHRLLEDRRAIETDDFLGVLPAVSSGAEELAGRSRIAAGTLIGPYRLLRELGQGGMSTVWLAERADEQVKRPVALKLPHAGPGQELLARRLLRERKILAELAHPHIARLYDVGLTELGMPYLVMEFVDGQTLLAHADAQRLTIAQRVALFQQVLSAVQYAHGKLVLHRDLKPSNILVTPSGEVKLLDFGIAKVMADEGGLPDATDLTRAADRRLTPIYASPEQLLGQSLSTASDVYSLGVILYELLCGQRPHATATGSAAQLEAAVLNDEPRPPSRRTPDQATLAARTASPGSLAKALRGDLDAIVIKALAMAPEQRYASAEALGADLGHWLVSEPVAARSPGAWVYFSKFVKRHQLSVSLSSGAVTALVVVSAVAFIQSRSANQEAERAATARDFLLQLFEEADPDLSGGVELTTAQLLDQGRTKATARLGNQPRLQAELLAGIAKTQFAVNDMTGADAALVEATRLFNQLGDRPKEAAALLMRIDLALEMKHLEDADRFIKDAARLLPAILDDLALHVQWLQLQGWYAKFTNDNPKARSLFKQCLDLADARQAEQARIMLDVLLALALMDAAQGQHAEAELRFQAATQLVEHGSGLTAVEAFGIVDVRSDTDSYAGRFAHLLAWLPASITACATSFGTASPICWRLKEKRQRALLLVGATEEALSHVSELTGMLAHANSPGKRHSSAITLARTLAFNGQTAAHPEPMAQLVQMVQANSTDALSPKYQLAALNTLAEVELLAKDPAKAQQWIIRAEAMAERAGPGGARERDKTHLFNGLVLQALGRHQAALAAMSMFCDETQLSKSLTPVPDRLYSLNCARSLAATAQVSQAVSLIRSALPVLIEGLGPDAPNTLRAQRLLDELLPGAARQSSTLLDDARIFSQWTIQPVT